MASKGRKTSTKKVASPRKVRSTKKVASPKKMTSPQKRKQPVLDSFYKEKSTLAKQGFVFVNADGDYIPIIKSHVLWGEDPTIVFNTEYNIVGTEEEILGMFKPKLTKASYKTLEPSMIRVNNYNTKDKLKVYNEFKTNLLKTQSDALESGMHSDGTTLSAVIEAIQEKKKEPGKLFYTKPERKNKKVIAPKNKKGVKKQEKEPHPFQEDEDGLTEEESPEKVMEEPIIEEEDVLVEEETPKKKKSKKQKAMDEAIIEEEDVLVETPKKKKSKKQKAMEEAIIEEEDVLIETPKKKKSKKQKAMEEAIIEEEDVLVETPKKKKSKKQKVEEPIIEEEDVLVEEETPKKKAGTKEESLKQSIIEAINDSKTKKLTKASLLKATKIEDKKLVELLNIMVKQGELEKIKLSYVVAEKKMEEPVIEKKKSKKKGKGVAVVEEPVIEKKKSKKKEKSVAVVEPVIEKKKSKKKGKSVVVVEEPVIEKKKSKKKGKDVVVVEEPVIEQKEQKESTQTKAIIEAIKACKTGKLTVAALVKLVNIPKEDIQTQLQYLVDNGTIEKSKQSYMLLAQEKKASPEKKYSKQKQDSRIQESIIDKIKKSKTKKITKAALLKSLDNVTEDQLSETLDQMVGDGIIRKVKMSYELV